MELIETPSIRDKLERILGFRDLNMRHIVYDKALVKWKECEDEASSWEQVSMLTKKFLELIFMNKKNS